MKLIAITPEQSVEHESTFISAILEHGFDYVHVRKPGYKMSEMRRYVSSIPAQYHNRLKLHSHFSLISEFDIAGLHINRHASLIPTGISRPIKLSKSCHDVNELTDLGEYEYVFLSPIFDSISKHGYKSKFTQDSLTETLHSPCVKGEIIALGGITPDHLPDISAMGFAGAAFLGYLFNSKSLNELNEKLTNIKTYIQCYNL